MNINALNIIWHKIRYWEYWPFPVLYFPVFFYYLYLCLRARSFFFFSAANPTIDFGGMLGESKSEIFDLIPAKYIPITHKFEAQDSFEEIRFFMKKRGLDYPIICKPDIGERGWKVEKIEDDLALQRYLSSIQVRFLVQEYVELPVELGVFYYRFPENKEGVVSSIVLKEMLHVIGDGESNIDQLLRKNVRAMMQYDLLKKAANIDLKAIPENGQKVELVPIGNHCKGTTFLNGNSFISPELTHQINKIAHDIDGFHFGRFDLRCESISALTSGENFYIMELNGAGAEPGHIYQPGYPLLRGYRDILFHLKTLCDISIANKIRGVDYETFRAGLKKMKAIREYNRNKN